MTKHTTASDARLYKRAMRTVKKAERTRGFVLDRRHRAIKKSEAGIIKLFKKPIDETGKLEREAQEIGRVAAFREMDRIKGDHALTIVFLQNDGVTRRRLFSGVCSCCALRQARETKGFEPLFHEEPGAIYTNPNASIRSIVRTHHNHVYRIALRNLLGVGK